MKISLIAIAALFIGLAIPARADDNNKSKIDQLGTSHTASVTQTGAGNVNDSFIKQVNGTNNEATVTQDGTGNSNTSILFQFVKDGVEILHQGGADNINYSKLTQSGFGNRAEIDQDGIVNVNDSLVEIQAGNQNDILVSQSGDGSNNHSNIGTFGTGNTVAVQQSGSDNMNSSDIVNGKQGHAANSSSAIVVQQ